MVSKITLNHSPARKRKKINGIMAKQAPKVRQSNTISCVALLNCDFMTKITSMRIYMLIIMSQVPLNNRLKII